MQLTHFFGCEILANIGVLEISSESFYHKGTKAQRVSRKGAKEKESRHWQDVAPAKQKNNKLFFP